MVTLDTRKTYTGDSGNIRMIRDSFDDTVTIFKTDDDGCEEVLVFTVAEMKELYDVLYAVRYG